MKATGNHKETVEDNLCACCGDAAREGHVLGLVRCNGRSDPIKVEIARADPRMEMLNSKSHV